MFCARVTSPPKEELLLDEELLDDELEVLVDEELLDEELLDDELEVELELLEEELLDEELLPGPPQATNRLLVNKRVRGSSFFNVITENLNLEIQENNELTQDFGA